MKYTHEKWSAMQRVLVAAVICTMMSVPVPKPVDAKTYEMPRDRKVAEILPADMIQGPHYRIRDKVISYGYMHGYTVDSDFGTFEVTGDAALRKLLKEIQGIAELQRIQQTDAFTTALKEAAKQPVKFGESLVTDPVDTVTGMPKGVYQIFSNTYTALTTKRDPRQDEAYESVLLLSSYKREYAYRLGVDVYSSNAVLQKELNRVGWAGAFGSLSVSAALTAVSGGAATAISTTRLGQSLNEVLRSEPPQKLRQLNESRLSNMGIPRETATRFLDSPAFSPRHDTIITESLRMVQRADGSQAFVQLISKAADEESANFYQHMAETLRGGTTGQQARRIATSCG